LSTSKERALRIVPRLFRRSRAADYCDVSLPTFLKLVAAGLLPPPRQLNDIEAWDRADLDRAIDSLPFGGTAPDTSWDD